jgi:hypothetical protein
MVRNRAQDGLRGPVKSCREESTTAAVPNVHPEIRSESTTEYDREGRVSSIRNQWDSSYWIVRYEYAPSGRLLKIASGNDEKSLSVTSYIYDEQGHIQKIVTDRQSDKPVSFHYDQHGRKTSIETSTAEDYQPNLATDGGPFEALAHAPNLPGGGTATTIYDDQDRPSEIQVRDATGQLVMHAVRRYDAQGRVSEEGQVQDNVAAMFPPEAKEKLLQESGFSLEQLQRQMQYW